MGMVRSPKSIAGSVGLALGNAPYSDGFSYSLNAIVFYQKYKVAAERGSP